MQAAVAQAEDKKGGKLLTTDGVHMNPAGNEMMAVGVLKAFGLNAEQIATLALVAEKEYHGTPSGVDTAVVARNEPIYFVKGRPARSIEIGPSEFHFLIADTGVSAATVEVPSLGTTERAILLADPPGHFISPYGFQNPPLLI